MCQPLRAWLYHCVTFRLQDEIMVLLGTVHNCVHFIQWYRSGTIAIYIHCSRWSRLFIIIIIIDLFNFSSSTNLFDYPRYFHLFTYKMYCIHFIQALNTRWSLVTVPQTRWNPRRNRSVVPTRPDPRWWRLPPWLRWSRRAKKAPNRKTTITITTTTTMRSKRVWRWKPWSTSPDRWRRRVENRPNCWSWWPAALQRTLVKSKTESMIHRIRLFQSPGRDPTPRKSRIKCHSPATDPYDVVVNTHEKNSPYHRISSQFFFFLNNILGWHTARVPRDDLHIQPWHGSLWPSGFSQLLWEHSAW